MSLSRKDLHQAIRSYDEKTWFFVFFCGLLGGSEREIIQLEEFLFKDKDEHVFANNLNDDEYCELVGLLLNVANRATKTGLDDERIKRFDAIGLLYKAMNQNTSHVDILQELNRRDIVTKENILAVRNCGLFNDTEVRAFAKEPPSSKQENQEHFDNFMSLNSP